MPAEEAFVLTRIDVRKIRQYVQHKYDAMPQDKRAEIVADAVTRIIQKQLPPFEDKLKREVTARLIRTTVLERQMPVRADDIFEACLSLDLADSDVVTPLHKWVEEQSGTQLEWDLFRIQLDKLAKNGKSETSASWEQLKEWLGSEYRLEGKKDAVTELAEVIPFHQLNPALKPYRRKQTLVYSFLSVILVSASLLYGWSLLRPSPNKLQPPVTLQSYEKVMPAVAGNELPDELRYTDVNKESLVDYLNSRDSLLAEQPYLDAIIDAAKTFDIHPLFLFAITGQEQAFVPKSNKQAMKIANNPFNVFYSWKDYNTTIHDSARIASQTVLKWSKNRPEGKDPIAWINRKYAEDQNWASGVSKIFASMKSKIERTS
ncbi:hypothetical protein PghCCS26_31420 [Paenibacillus glycanilyticus]|uniref:Mannosyl-glycoprotein endo-beta-N-acetylglucosamidase-like domain-containing protein n=1 Tax=Paenibacillus glycanilyticus TaxID=126569 RepID=A0ABQ6NMK7_9BACL|nr:hypothetical protein [Paenibacillus glycanilyticus]GMK46014.1 hypothetical protein PghCCS26_31420 [Paenibacillus glycanilyticus]